MEIHDKSATKNVRKLSLSFDPFGYADASVLFEQGKTKIFCSITLQNGVPPFCRGQDTGWLTAEYAMLPSSTYRRKSREIMHHQRNPRCVEISRLIGRSLRAVVDLKAYGERTIIIDCDVLQADGGTRTAAITASSCALAIAEQRWLKTGLIRQKILQEDIAGLSVGIVNNTIITDLDQRSDNQAQADFNFVLTRTGKIIEIQGTAEKHPISWDLFEQLKESACSGIKKIFQYLDVRTEAYKKNIEKKQQAQKQITSQAKKNVSTFSLAHQISNAE